MADLDALAAVLGAAYATGTPVPPLTETYDGLTLDDAYAIQQILFRRGFLDEEGAQVPSRTLAKLRHLRAVPAAVPVSTVVG